ncbi:MAG TPA: hypothetical protein DIU15_06235 [Deltaproteobacteria bacterium]|nr:hypothetical protein [Deltaproteobacteria bacterium]HCP45618.1 hypothetical protein [Deltaproteobacteria bacterium]|tara:strand:- start:991 stop:1368 length:378 start_codon:yes stop_codon:yes gene_type:complete
MARHRIVQRLTELPSFEAGLRAILILNLFDAFCTLIWLQAGMASEANPVMAGAFVVGPGFFLTTKVALVCMAVVLLWWHRSEMTARLALVPLSALYALIAGTHIGFAIYQGLLAAPVGMGLEMVQ